MQFIEFSLQRFRRFDSKVTFKVDPYTILVGSNNEGKTTVCDALTIFASHLGFNSSERRNRLRPLRRSIAYRTRYNLERDYPQVWEGKSGRRHPTEFIGKFKIDASESNQVVEITGWPVTKTHFSIKVTWDYTTSRLVHKSDGLSDKVLNDLLILMREKIRFIVVPAVRDQDTLNENIMNVFEEAISSALERSKTAKKLEDQLSKIIAPAIDGVKKQVTESMHHFVRNVKDVDITWTTRLDRIIGLESIIVDDGTKTSIDLKGDGIKNLMWLGNLTYLASIKQSPSDVSRIFVIEEPEAHLNSSILYGLKEQIIKLASSGRVVVTTHSPVLLDFRKGSATNLVLDGKITATAEKKLIAETLGVRLQENLLSNDVAIIVEGFEETVALKSLAKHFPIADKMSRIDFISANGTGNVPSVFLQHQNFYRTLFVMLDKDVAGIEAKKQLDAVGFDSNRLFLCPSDAGFKEAELEDLVDIEFLIEKMSAVYARSFSLDGAKQMRKRYKSKFKEWIIPFVNTCGLNLQDADSLKRQVWDVVAQTEDLKLTLLGKTYIQSLFETVASEL